MSGTVAVGRRSMLVAAVRPGVADRSRSRDGSSRVTSMPPSYRGRPRERKHQTTNTAILAVVDDTDSEILRVLRADARVSWRDLGAAVGLSANAAGDRVRRMRRAGIITG